MFQALGHLLPIAIAVALSSVPITATILILLSENRNRSAVPFMIGWMIGIAAIVVVFTLSAGVLPSSSSPSRPQPVIGIAELVIGAAVIVFAVFTWRRSRNKPASELPAWLRAVGGLGPWPSFGVALGLNIRPKSLLLAAAAGLALRGASLAIGSAAIAIGIFTVIAATSVAIPIILTLANPERMEPRLVSIRNWITRNNRVVTISIMILIGIVIFADGLTRL